MTWQFEDEKERKEYEQESRRRLEYADKLEAMWKTLRKSNGTSTPRSKK